LHIYLEVYFSCKCPGLYFVSITGHN
jgi:hypothetical protein